MFHEYTVALEIIMYRKTMFIYSLKTYADYNNHQLIYFNVF